VALLVQVLNAGQETSGYRVQVWRLNPLSTYQFFLFKSINLQPMSRKIKTMKKLSFVFILGFFFHIHATIGQVAADTLTLATDTAQSAPMMMDAVTAIEQAKPEGIDYENVFNDKRIDWAVKLVRPYRKGWLTKKRIKATRLEVLAFIAENFPDYELLYFKSGKKKKWCNYIFLLDKRHAHDFSALPTDNPSETAKFLKRYLPVKKYPRSKVVFEDLLHLVTDVKEAEQMIDHALDNATWFAAILKRLSFEKDLDAVLARAPDLIGPGKNQTAAVCISALSFSKSTKEFSELQEIGCNAEDIANKAIEILECDAMIELSDSLPAGKKNKYLRKVEYTVASCVGADLPFYRYYDTYNETGPYLENAYENYLAYAIQQGAHWDFIVPHKPIAQKYREGTIAAIKNTVQDANDLVRFNRVFDLESDMAWAMNWAMDNLDPTALEGLFTQTKYINHIHIIESKLISKAEIDIIYAYLALKLFPAKSENLNTTYIAVIRQEVDTNKRDQVILAYTGMYGEESLSAIKDVMDQRLTFLIAQKHESLRTTLKPECLKHVNNIYWYNRFVALYPNAMEVAFDRIVDGLTTEELKGFFGQTKLRTTIGRVYLDAATGIKDIEWFLDNYSTTHERRRDAYDMGFNYLKKGPAKTKLTAEFLKEFNLDLRVVQQNIGCDQMLPFLDLLIPTPSDWLVKLADMSLSCFTMENLTAYEKHFGHLPEFNKKLQQAVSSRLKKAREKNTATLPTVIDKLAQKDTITKSFDLQAFDNPILVFKTKDYEGLATNILYDGQPAPITINADNAVVMVPQGTKELTIQFTNTKTNGAFSFSSSNTKPVEVFIYDSPSILRTRLSSVLNNQSLRKKFLDAAERVAENNETRADYNQILGGDFLKFVEDKQALDGGLKSLASDIALLYLDLAKPYISDSKISKLVRAFERVFDETVDNIGRK